MDNSLDPLEQLSNAISSYRKNYNTFDLKALQDIRDKISLSLHYLSGNYSDSRFNTEHAEYQKKKAMATVCESLRGKKDEVTQKFLTREQISDKAIILTEASANKLAEVNKEYYNMRLLFETGNQILNSISSRINLTK